MTNETESHSNGATEDLAAIAAVTAATTETAAPTEPAEPKPPSFDDLGLHPDIKSALDDMGYFAPTAVQAAVYTPVSEGKDLLVQSRTGTGKTTAFGLPTLSKIVPTQRTPQALVLAPTRELALQVARELTKIGQHRGIVVEAIYGGAPIGKQITNLKNGVHVIVGTPGRVLDHIGRRTLDTKTISTFILDECDEMLSMGFLEDIERVVAALPEKKQTLLFSATMPEEVARYSRRHMVAPVQMSLSRDGQTVSDIHHAYYIVSGIARSRDLLKVILSEEPDSAIIFCNMRDETTMVAKFLQKQGYDAEPLSSDLSQSDRERVMGRMKAKNLRFLCATDVAARGIDISDLSHVINYSVGDSPEVYVHRTGRTGRAGKKGVAISLVGPRELGNFRLVRLTFGLKPEERLLPKDDIFVGKLKVPLPPIGIPQPPDPVQILIRGVQNQANDLETKIFEKLLSTAAGKKTLAALVAEKLDKLSTRAKPKRERAERPEGDAPAAEGQERSFDRADRPEGDRGPRPDRGDRPFGDRGPRRFDRDGGGAGGERGDRPRRFDREGGGERSFDRDRGPRPEGDRGPRPEGDRGPRPDGDRPRFDADRGPRPEGGERPEGDRGPRGDRPERSFDRDRGDRPRRFDREGGGERSFDRDRGPRGDRPDGDRGPRPEGDRGPRPDGDRGPRLDGDRGPRPEGDRGPRPEGDRGPRAEGGERPEGDRQARSDRPDGDRGPRGDRERRPWGERNDRGEGRRFERNNAAPAAEAAPAAAPVVSEGAAEAAPQADVRPERDGRDRDRGGRDRGRDRDRGGRGERGERSFDRDRNNDRGEGRRDRGETVAEVRTDAVVTEAPAAEPAKVEDVAARAVERADKKPAAKGKKSEATGDTKEFWETWADDKASRPAPAPKAAAPAADAEEVKADDEKPARGGRDRGGRGRGGDKDRAPRGRGKVEASDDKPAEKPAGRTKRDTTVTPPPAAAAATGDGAQARLFVSLGKKNGVSADDLRALLSAPIGGDPATIGSISLRDSHAHVRVSESHADAIIKAVHGKKHKDQDVTVERARA